MGHNIYRTSFPENCNRRDVLNNICERANREGDGYSGPMHWHDEVPPLPNREAAEKWITAHDTGWYNDHAVRYYDHSKASITPKIKELQEKHAALCIKIAKYEKSHSVKNLKATFIGCPNCSSKLSKEYLRSERCPLCGTDLRSKTTLDTLAGYRAKQKEITNKIAQEQEKQKAARRILWLVKYEFHS